MATRTPVGPDASGFDRRTLPQMDRARQDRPNAPSRLAIYTTASLPLASLWQGCIAFDSTLGVPVMSDGTYWYPISVGAHL